MRFSRHKFISLPLDFKQQKRTKMKKLSLILVVALLATACCNCRNASPKNHKPLNATEWTLWQMNGRNVAADLTEGKAPTLVLSADGSYGGFGGCNSYGGEFKITPSEIKYQKESVGKIEFGPMYSTKRYCPDDRFEYAFFNVLDGVDSFTIEGDVLYLFEGGELKLVFKAK